VISTLARRVRYHWGLLQSRVLRGRRYPATELAFSAEIPPLGEIRIGEGTYGDPRISTWRNTDKVVIGRYCSIGRSVRILAGGEHPIGSVSTYPLRTMLVHRRRRNVDVASKGPVVIGSDVWIGDEAMILSGVSIGNGAVVAARSLVTSDVPPFTVVGGQPARVLKQRFSPEQVARLQEVAWWEWPRDRILDNIDLFDLPVDAFLGRVTQEAGRQKNDSFGP